MSRALGWLLVFLAKTIATLVVVAIPVLGVWAASSLVAYRNGPIWVAIVAGVLLFPVVPLAWDAVGQWRRRRKGDSRPRILTFWDRIVVRSFVLNFVFLAAFLGLWPKTIFTALSTRGDWMIEAWDDRTGARVRGWLLDFADGLSWLYDAAHENPYEQFADAEPLPTPAPNPGLTRDTDPDPDTEADADPDTDTATDAAMDPAPDTEPDAPPEPDGPRAWPFPATLHPLVRDFPVEHETSPAAVARYVTEREPDPFLRIKALHDWVADRIAYDAPAYRAGTYPPQDAQTVFRERKGVCAGYAQLMVALGRAIGEEIVYVVGDARVRDSVSGEPHAWNAVRIEGDWYLMDVTWDAGHIEGDRFVKRYSTIHFLTPPEVFGLRHFPDRPEWQLRERPLTRGEFNRQPMLRAEFFAHGMRLLEPARSQVDVDGRVKLVIDNPRGRFLLGKYRPRAGGSGGDGECDVRNGRRAEVLCAFPRPGAYEVELYDGPERYGQYWGVGSIDVNNR